MTEEQIKFLCKFALENGNRQLTKAEKEIAKTAIDESKTLGDLLAVALIVASK